MKVGEHLGVDIMVDTKGEFVARINNKVVRAASVAAVKRKLEAARAFEPFSALIADGRVKPRIVKVIGVQAAKGRHYSWRSRAEWIIEGGDHRPVVYPDTPKSRTALTNYLALSVRHDKEVAALRERHMREREAAQKKLQELKAGDALKKGSE